MSEPTTEELIRMQERFKRSTLNPGVNYTIDATIGRLRSQQSRIEELEAANERLKAALGVYENQATDCEGPRGEGDDWTPSQDMTLIPMDEPIPIPRPKGFVAPKSGRCIDDR